VLFLYYRFTSSINKQQFRGLQQFVYLNALNSANFSKFYFLLYRCIEIHLYNKTQNLLISIHLYNKNQLDVLYILSLFHQSTSTRLGHICSPSSGSILYIYNNWYVLCFLVDCLFTGQQTEQIVHQVGFHYTDEF
jgi:hypothetical protein